jgi:hypothetical protein
MQGGPLDTLGFVTDVRTDPPGRRVPSPEGQFPGSGTSSVIDYLDHLVSTVDGAAALLPHLGALRLARGQPA